MPSYFITGVSRGIGYGFLSHLSQDPSNTVIGLVRNKPETVWKIAEDKSLKNRTNIHILQGDVADYASLKVAAEETSKITSGRLDYVIANAGIQSEWAAFDGLGELGQRDPLKLEEELNRCFQVNVVGNIHLFNVLLPLVLKGDVKKVITLGSGHADDNLSIELKIHYAGPYAISKTAMNHVITKYHAEYADKGVLFLSVSPGAVSTGMNNAAPTEEIQRKIGEMFASFQKKYPNFAGPITPEESVGHMMKVIEKFSLENGNGGTAVSHFGDRNWL